MTKVHSHLTGIREKGLQASLVPETLLKSCHLGKVGLPPFISVYAQPFSGINVAEFQMVTAPDQILQNKKGTILLCVSNSLKKKKIWMCAQETLLRLHTCVVKILFLFHAL